MPALPPKCLSLVICESVVEDIKTRMKSVFNIFNNVDASEFPVEVHPICVFASITDGHGHVEITLRVMKNDDQTEIAREVQEHDFGSPLEVIDIVATLKDVSIPEPGTYFVQVLANKTLVAERRFHVEQTDTQDNEEVS